MELFLTLGLMVIGAFVAGMIAKALKQPLLLGYVIAGVALGPALLNMIHASESLALLSELGLIFLMFIIGLELDLKQIKGVGVPAIFGGFLQVALTVAIGAGIASLTELTFHQGMYFGLLIAFSSTLIVVKVLADRRELSSLHGELALGILVVQDILAVVSLSLLGAFSSSETLPGVPTIQLFFERMGWAFFQENVVANLAFSGILFAGTAFLLFKLILPLLSRGFSGSHEIFFVFTLAAVFTVAMLAGFFQLSFAVGAFVGGIALSSSLHSHDIIGRVKPLRDFFLILFFVSLGIQVSFQGFLAMPLLLLILGAMILKPVITFLILRIFKYHARTAFLTSVHLGQVGEFGLIIISAGVFSGTLPQSALTSAVLATVITMTLTAYVMRYDERLYRKFGPLLSRFDRFFGTREEEQRSVPLKYQPDTLFFGITRTSEELIRGAKQKKLLLIDANSMKLEDYRSKGIPVFCTDAINQELYEGLDFSKVKLVISMLKSRVESISGPDPNAFLIRKIRHASKDAFIIVSADTEQVARKLYRLGATMVLVPSILQRRLLRTLLSETSLDRVHELGKSYRNELLWKA